jgi:membrane-bound lytic murein transglycosylase B
MRHLIQLNRVAGIVLMLAAVAGHAAAPRAVLSTDAQAFVQQMVESHGFERESLERELRGAKFLDSIVRAMESPSTALPWHEFRPRHVNDIRIDGGLAFWARHAELLERAAAEYRVPPEIIVATIGIETAYGRNTGRIGVLDALVTLAFGYPKRAEFFRGELEQFLLLARENGWKLAAVKGSYAGAIGVPQFLPSSYRRYAVDFDGDGHRDLRKVADAIGSVANYYRHFGWQPGMPVIIPADVGDSAVDAALAAGIKPHTTVAEFRKSGVLPLEPVAEDAKAALIAVEEVNGPRYWLGLNNFYVITRYNRSVNYAMTVQELSAALRLMRERRLSAR